MPIPRSRVLSEVPAETIDWLLDPENPGVAVLTRRELLGEADSAATIELWARRNEYAPVAAILAAQLEMARGCRRRTTGSTRVRCGRSTCSASCGRTATIPARSAPPNTRSLGSWLTARGARATCGPRARSRA